MRISVTQFLRELSEILRQRSVLALFAALFAIDIIFIFLERAYGTGWGFAALMFWLVTAPISACYFFQNLLLGQPITLKRILHLPSVEYFFQSIFVAIPTLVIILMIVLVGGALLDYGSRLSGVAILLPIFLFALFFLFVALPLLSFLWRFALILPHTAIDQDAPLTVRPPPLIAQIVLLSFISIVIVLLLLLMIFGAEPALYRDLRDPWTVVSIFSTNFLGFLFVLFQFSTLGILYKYWVILPREMQQNKEIAQNG